LSDAMMSPPFQVSSAPTVKPYFSQVVHTIGRAIKTHRRG
jgi:hypothetical protein